MRAVTRWLHKVVFFRETMTDFGPLLTRSETDGGLPIVRASTPRPEPLASDSTAPDAFLIDDTHEEHIFV